MSDSMKSIIVFLQLCVAAGVIVSDAITFHNSLRNLLLCPLMVSVEKSELVSSKKDAAH